MALKGYGNSPFRRVPGSGSGERSTAKRERPSGLEVLQLVSARPIEGSSVPIRNLGGGTLSNHGSVVGAPVAPHIIATVSVIGAAVQTVDAVIVAATAAAALTITTEAATKIAAAESTSSIGVAAIAGKRTV